MKTTGARSFSLSSPNKVNFFLLVTCIRKLPFFHKRKALLKLDQSVKMP